MCQRSVIGYGIIQDINYNSLHLLYSQRKTPFSIRLSLFIASFDSLAIIWFALSISSAISVFIWFVQFSFQHPCHTVNVHTYFDLTLLQVLPFHTLAVPFWIPQGFHRFPVMSCHFLPSLSSLKLHVMCSQRLYLEEPDIFPFFPLRECFFREFYAPAWLTRMPKNLLHSLFKIRIILAIIVRFSVKWLYKKRRNISWN